MSLRRKSSTIRRSITLERNHSSIHDPTIKIILPESYILLRCAGWRSVLKSIIHTLKDMVKAERALAASHDKILKTNFQTKERELAFQQESWANKIISEIQISQAQISKSHSSLADSYENSLILPLRNIKIQVKKLIDEVTSSKQKREKERQKEKENLQFALKNLKTAVSLFNGNKENRGDFNFKKEDPWLLQFAFRAALETASKGQKKRKDQSTEELNNYVTFEEGILNQFKGIFSVLHKSSSLAHGSLRTSNFSNIADVVSSIDPKKEWASFVKQYNDFPKNSEPSLESVDNTELLNDPLLKLVKQGKLQRPKALLKGWKDCHYVLTPAGFLYEFEASLDWDSLQKAPTFSTSIPLAPITLEPSLNDDGKEKEDEFLLTELVNKKFSGNDFKVYSFKAASASDGEAWMDKLSKYCKMIPQEGPLLPSNGSIRSLSRRGSLRSISSRKSTGSRKFGLFRSNSKSSIASGKTVETKNDDEKKGWFGGILSGGNDGEEKPDTESGIKRKGSLKKDKGKGKAVEDSKGVSFSPSTVNDDQAPTPPEKTKKKFNIKNPFNKKNKAEKIVITKLDDGKKIEE
ncbi:hypothetical protein HDU92_003632 [Lobulomyces angularis]|nr:hypothetical protein HDU92_003632 [Lobulomyces angularis]